MYLLAHAGITVGTALLLNRLIGGHSADTPEDSRESSAGTPAKSRFGEAWVTSLGRRIDLRVLLAGSLLPDLVDKPIGLLLYDSLGYRLYCHTLLFLVVTAVAGLCLYLSLRKNWLLVLAFGVFAHLVLDEVWLDPTTFLWPLKGISLSESAEAFSEIARYYFVLEVVGLVVLVGIAWVLIRRRNVLAFIRHGRV